MVAPDIADEPFHTNAEYSYLECRRYRWAHAQGTLTFPEYLALSPVCELKDTPLECSICRDHPPH
jgi:hypothetical protein